MKTKQYIKSNQEQAVASWINYLNQVRLDKLMDDLNAQDENFFNAIEEMKWAKLEIDNVIDSNRGGQSGAHGFIAEIAETGINNAKHLIHGASANMQWVDDNGMVDFIRDGVAIQQKFYQSDGLSSLGAVEAHLKHYPDFIKSGMKYQIPKDQYENVKYLASLNEKEAYASLNSNTEPTLAQWGKVHSFFDRSDVKLDDLEPAHVKYGDVQKGTINNTLENTNAELKEEDSELRKEAYEKSKPSVNEGEKVAAVSAVIEGGTTFVMEITKKIKSGKKLSDFSEEDWKKILKSSGISTIKGGIRGASIYALSNYTCTPTFVASSITTASFGIVEQVYL